MTEQNQKPDLNPVQLRAAPVLTMRRVDAYYAMTVVAPPIARAFRAGQFVAVAVGGPQSSMLLRRAFSIHDVGPDHGGTVEIVIAAHGPGHRVKTMSATHTLPRRRFRDTASLFWLVRLKSEIRPITGSGIVASLRDKKYIAATITTTSANPPHTAHSSFFGELFTF